MVIYAYELWPWEGHRGSYVGLHLNVEIVRVQLLFSCDLENSVLRKMLDLQHQYNNCTTIPHMRVDPTYWGPPSCEGLLYSCCISVVQESNPQSLY
jgi:hypothetical protein